MVSRGVKSWFIRNFWMGYSLFEKFFLLAMLILQIVVFCIAPDTPLGIIAGIAGVISVVLCAKGKVTFYFIGFIQTISYLFLAWQNCFYGEVIENIFYLVTMVWGIFVWKNNSVKNDDGTENVEAKKFTVTQWVIAAIGTAIATVAIGYWLNSIGSHQAYTDAATNVLAIFAQLLMVRRYREQWIWWIVIDLLCIKMWFVAGNWSMVAMYVAWTANCIYGWFNWSKLNKEQVLWRLTKKDFVPESLQWCREHYVPPVKAHIHCPHFGSSDGMDGGCWWCDEMTPYQWYMCRDESWLNSLIRSPSFPPGVTPVKYNRKSGAEFIEQYKQKHPMR